MRFFVGLEGVDALERLAATAEAGLERDLARASFRAAEAGVEEVRAHHRYHDDTYQLTNSAGAVAVDDEADMTWPMPYAGFVDATRYNFTRAAETRAARSLEISATAAAKDFVRKVR